MRAVSAKVINNFKKRMSQRTVTTDENNNIEKPTFEEKPTCQLRKPKIFVEQVFEMRKMLKDFDQQSLQDEIDTLIAGVCIPFTNLINFVTKNTENYQF